MSVYVRWNADDMVDHSLERLTELGGGLLGLGGKKIMTVGGWFEVEALESFRDL